MARGKFSDSKRRKVMLRSDAMHRRKVQEAPPAIAFSSGYKERFERLRKHPETKGACEAFLAEIEKVREELERVDVSLRYNKMQELRKHGSKLHARQVTLNSRVTGVKKKNQKENLMIITEGTLDELLSV